MMLAENQVIERNLDHLPAGEVLLVDALPDNALQTFTRERPDIRWTAFTPFFDTYQQLNNNSQASYELDFGAWLDGSRRFDAVVIYYPKTKLRFDYYLSLATKLLKDDGMLYVVGEKKGGVKSCDKGLKPFCVKPYKLDAARHCMMFAAAFNGQPCSKSFDDWFSSTKLDIQVSNETVSLELKALPGVFSANRLDEGSALLLETIETVSGHGLDFGCGCGVLSAAIAKRFGCKMTGVDVDALAIASSNQTFAHNGIEAEAVCSDGLSYVLERQQKFDFIVTNPPFHTGIKTDYGITETFIQQAKRVLQPKYHVWMVANAFLPYPDIFKRYLKPVEIKSKNNRFNIYYTGSKSA